MGDGLGQFADGAWGAPEMWGLVKATFWFATVFLLLALFVYVVRKLRRAGARDERDASELLSEFRDLHGRGTLSDDEYKSIKGKLAAGLRDELKGNDSTH